MRRRKPGAGGKLYSARSIPVVRSSQYSASSDGSDSAAQANVQRAVSILNGPIPAVFVKGMGKANPSADEVIAEYQRTR